MIKSSDDKIITSAHMENDPFEIDDFPGKPKILFVGHPSSSHTHAWIGLLADTEINIRLFSSSDGYPPEDWKIRTYITSRDLPRDLSEKYRKTLFPLPSEFDRYNDELNQYHEIFTQYNQALSQHYAELDQHNLALSQHYTELEQYNQESEQYYREVHEYLSKNFLHKLITFVRRGINVFTHRFNLPTLQDDLPSFQSRFRQNPRLGYKFRRSLPTVLSNYTLLSGPPDLVISSVAPLQPGPSGLAISSVVPLHPGPSGLAISSVSPVQPGPPVLSLPPVPPVAPILPASRTDSPATWLAQIIHQWHPDIIHTLGLFDGQGGELYYETLMNYKLEGLGKWVLQLRGGSDLTLRRNDPEIAPRLTEILSKSHIIISDNRINIEYADQLGIHSEKFASIVPVPGTGGIDIKKIVKARDGQPSKRRLILVPKAYECIWSKMAPVFEAVRLAWEQMKPCEIVFLAMDLEARAYYNALPQSIRDRCRIYNRIPRAKALRLMGQARVLLAPSLVDGVPSVLYEAMAAGAMPIVSPIETLKPLFENGKNVLFARNLYPKEIASSLIRAMKDDTLVDSAAESNLELVNVLANRNEIKKKVINFYTGLLM